MVAAAGAGCGSSTAAKAVDFPTKPITLVIPYAPGGASDIIGRVIDKYTAKVFGHHFTFKYMPGAGGSLGTAFVASSNPNGYTIETYNLPNLDVDPVVGSGGYSISDFSYIGELVADHQALVATKSSPYKTLAEFIAAAKAHPGKITVAIPSVFDGTEIALWELEKAAKFTVTIVPFQGGSAETAALLGNHVDVAMYNLSNLASATSEVDILGVSAAHRLSQYPNVPTFSELGYPVTTVEGRVIIAPKGIPAPVLAILRKGFKKIYDNPSFQADMTKIDQPLQYESGQAVQAYVKAQYPRIKALIQQFDPSAVKK